MYSMPARIPAHRALRVAYRDWLFAVSFIALASFTFLLETRIESSMQSVEIDYN